MAFQVGNQIAKETEFISIPTLTMGIATGDGNLSRLMLIRDAYNPTYAENYGGGTWWFANAGSLPLEKDTYAGMIHASFADGHVQAFPREEMTVMMQSGASDPMFINVYTFD